jgi:hypothetical protein
MLSTRRSARSFGAPDFVAMVDACRFGDSRARYSASQT